MSRRRTLIANEIPNLQFDTDIIVDEADKRRRVSGTSNHLITWVLTLRLRTKLLLAVSNLLTSDSGDPSWSFSNLTPTKMFWWKLYSAGKQTFFTWINKK